MKAVWINSGQPFANMQTGISDTEGVQKDKNPAIYIEINLYDKPEFFI